MFALIIPPIVEQIIIIKNNIKVFSLSFPCVKNSIIIVVNNSVINEQMNPDINPLKLHFFAEKKPLIRLPNPTQPQK